MSNSAENTTSTVGTASESRQGGIPLTESAPLSHNPFVHVTLDATERSKQVEQPPARPVGQPMPIWAQQRAFGHMPDKNPRVARTFPQQKTDAGDNVASAGSSNISRAIPAASARSAVRSNDAPVTAGPSRSRRSSDGDSSKNPSDPALRVVLEQKQPELETESQVVDGVEGKVEIGNDHISVPSDIYAQDELNDLAANMPLIPSNLIFGKGAPSASQPNAGRPFNRMSAPAHSNFASSPMETGRMGVAWPQNGSNPMGNTPNPYLQGNPRNAMASNAGVSALPAMDSAAFGSPMASANPSFAGSMQAGSMLGSGIAGAAMGAAAMNSASSMPGSVPSIPSVPASTDYRPYAAGGLGAAYNPLHPNPPASFAAGSAPISAWSAQSDMAARSNGAPAPYPDPTFASAMGTPSPSMSQPLGSAGRSDLYNSQPLDRMRGADSHNLQGSSAFPTASDSRVEKTLPSGMPVSFDSQPSSVQRSAQMRSVPAFGDAGRSAMSDLPSPASAPSSAFPSNGDRGVPLDAGTPIPRYSFSKPIKTGAPKIADVENESLFDQPPVPITEGMKSADTSHKKLRRLVMIILIAVVLALGGIIGYLVYSGTVNPAQLVPHITIEASSDGSSGNNDSPQNGNDSSSSSAASSSSGDGAAGSVVYQYTALTRDRTAYTVEETATFSDDGYCQFTTMKMRFPDAEKAKSFTDNLALDYGNTFTLDSLDGANATVTIDNSALRLDREKYEESLRYSVEDLVILKK